MDVKTAFIGLLVFTAACSRGAVAPFSELDRDGDGRISRQEAADDARISQLFGRLDSDRNGELSPHEYLHVAQMR